VTTTITNHITKLNKCKKF